MTKTIADADDARAEIENLRLDISELCRQFGLDAREFIVDYRTADEPNAVHKPDCWIIDPNNWAAACTCGASQRTNE